MHMLLSHFPLYVDFIAQSVQDGDHSDDRNPFTNGFLGAAAGSPYIVFITRFRRMASGHGYIYIYI